MPATLLGGRQGLVEMSVGRHTWPGAGDRPSLSVQGSLQMGLGSHKDKASFLFPRTVSSPSSETVL